MPSLVFHTWDFTNRVEGGVPQWNTRKEVVFWCCSSLVELDGGGKEEVKSNHFEC